MKNIITFILLTLSLFSCKDETIQKEEEVVVMKELEVTQPEVEVLPDIDSRLAYIAMLPLCL